ncbi:MAG: hypothetical protein PHE55_00055 [Methylococcaceae bacterium]|nr:hypothetical protein [Methylococcaceae bacterium]
MTQQERLHRQDPKRSEPIRNLTGFLRNSHSWGENPPGEEPGKTEPQGSSEKLDDVLTHGVHLGYKIIEEQISQGQRVAQRLRKRYPPMGDREGDGGGEIDALISRLLGLTKDMGTLWFDSMEMVLKTPRLLRGLAGGEEQGEVGIASNLAETHISIEIASSKRAQVSLNLPSRPQRYIPLVHALYATNPAFPPLTGISFRHCTGSPHPILQVEIPDHQPASTYTGVVADGETNEPVGTLVVRVLA